MIAPLNELVRQQWVTAIEGLKVDKHTSYTHNSSVQDFQQAIVEVLDEDMLAEITQSPHFSVMVESTDISNSQNLVVYIRYLVKSKGRSVPVTDLLGLRRLTEGATAGKITGEVLAVLREKGIDVQKLSGVATDGAAVMVGHKSGVLTRLKREVPGVFGTHCIAHRLALGCATAADSIPYLFKYQEIVNGVFKYLTTPLKI